MTETTPSRRAGLRDEISKAIHRYDNHHALSGNDIPSRHHRGEADAVMAILYREWPWLRAEAEELTEARAAVARVQALADEYPAGIDTALIHQALDQPAPAPAATEATERDKTTRVFAALHRSAEQDVSRVIALYEQWVKAGAPPIGTSMSRWWDARLVELRSAILPPAPAPTDTQKEN